MREIKFRAWHKSAEAMLQIGDSYGTTHPLDCCAYAKLGQPVELMQYTGLKDRNGREIYEGDIVSFEDFYIGNHRQVGGNGVVKFVDDGWDVFDFNEPQAGLLDMVNNCGAEVIGNIYESPELLK